MPWGQTHRGWKSTEHPRLRAAGHGNHASPHRQARVLWAALLWGQHTRPSGLPPHGSCALGEQAASGLVERNLCHQLCPVLAGCFCRTVRIYYFAYYIFSLRVIFFQSFVDLVAWIKKKNAKKIPERMRCWCWPTLHAGSVCSLLLREISGTRDDLWITEKKVTCDATEKSKRIAQVVESRARGHRDGWGEKGPATKPDSLSLIPGSFMTEGENGLLEVVLWPPRGVL